MRLHRIGVVVEDIERHGRLYSEHFGVKPLTGIAADRTQRLNVPFWRRPSQVSVELIEPAAEDSPPRGVLVVKKTAPDRAPGGVVWERPGPVGVRADSWTGGFGQYRQAILEPTSALYRFNPDIVLLYLRGEELFADHLEQPFEPGADTRRQLGLSRTEETRRLAARMQVAGGTAEACGRRPARGPGASTRSF